MSPAAQKQSGSYGPRTALESRGRVRERRGRARLEGGRGTVDPGTGQPVEPLRLRAETAGFRVASPRARPPQEGVCFHSAAPGWPPVEDLDSKAYGDSCWLFGVLRNPDYSEAEPG